MQEKTEHVELCVEHVRAARGLLKWTQEDLAARSGVSAVTIGAWENEKTRPMADTKEQIRRAFEEAGVVFSNGKNPGVKLMREG